MIYHNNSSDCIKIIINNNLEKNLFISQWDDVKWKQF